MSPDFNHYVVYNTSGMTSTKSIGVYLAPFLRFRKKIDDSLCGAWKKGMISNGTKYLKGLIVSLTTKSGFSSSLAIAFPSVMLS